MQKLKRININLFLGKYNIPDGWTRRSKPGGHTVKVAPDGTMYRSSIDKSVMQHAILQNLDYYGWAKKVNILISTLRKEGDIGLFITQVL